MSTFCSECHGIELIMRIRMLDERIPTPTMDIPSIEARLACRLCHLHTVISKCQISEKLTVWVQMQDVKSIRTGVGSTWFCPLVGGSGHWTPCVGAASRGTDTSESSRYRCACRPCMLGWNEVHSICSIVCSWDSKIGHAYLQKQ